MTATSMRPMLLHDLLDRAAEERQEAPAIAGTSGEPMTYRELRGASHAIADLLRAHGVGRTDRVLVTQSADPLLAALLYGASRLGAAFVVVHDQTRPEILGHIIGDCEPALVVTDVDDVAAQARSAGIPALDHRALDDAVRTIGRSYTGPEPLPVDPACLIYTSGTTALPKAIVSTHAQAVFAIEAIASRLRYRPSDVVYCPLPMSFDYGLYQIFLATEAGARLRLASPTDVGPGLLSRLVDEGATVLPAVPPVSAALVRLLRRDPSRRPPLRLVTNTGAHLAQDVTAALRELLPDLQVQLMYGLTECKRVSILDPDEDLRQPGSVGRPLPGTEVFAVAEDGDRLSPNMLGELTVRGPNVMAGYWRRPELTAQRFVRRDGLFPELRTGDYGWVDDAGYVYFQGRRDDVYKQQGFRVSAVEVEHAATRLPEVEGASVLVPAPDRPEAVLVITGDCDPEQARHGLRDHLEDFKIPPRCVVVNKLPTNANGKIDRTALARRIEEGAGV